MKINFPVNNKISFAKSLKATCAIMENNQAVPCSIYRLDESDSEYFEKMIFRKDWEKSIYIMRADEAVNKTDKNDVFVLENDKNKCLGFCITYDCGDKKNLAYLETMPKLAKKNKKRKTKYVGESLIAFLMKTSPKGHDFLIKYVLGDAIPFYEQCGFNFTEGTGCAFTVNDEQKNNMVKRFENKTENELSIVC